MVAADSSLSVGLTEDEAVRRLEHDGPNELASSKRQTLLEDAVVIVREPMSLLLVACGVLYLVLGDVQEALMLLGFVFFIMGITLFQEHKTTRALDALRDLASPRALVIRDGERHRIPGREVVEGDLVVLSEGDRVPADTMVLESTHLSIDESLLTGEAVPVRKVPWDGTRPLTRPGGEDLPFAYAGTLVVQGSAMARVHATGRRTEIGRIGQALGDSGPSETRLQRETRYLVARLAWVGAGLSVLVVGIYAFARGSILDGILAGLTLAMAILPNEFPVVVTAFLALGAWRLSKRRVLTRRVPAIEAIGAVTVLCVDKTGTLTQNRMVVRELSVDGEVFDVRLRSLPETFHPVVEYSILASRRDPFDPMERAFKQLGERRLSGTEHLHAGWAVVREYPFSSKVLAVTQVWRTGTEPKLVVAMKGAPEAVASFCRLDPGERRELKEHADWLAREGRRVLAVARATAREGVLPDDPRHFDFQLVGLVSLEDPLRRDVPQAVAQCHGAGIRVVMMTGDYPTTALSIARQAGLDESGGFLTGEEIGAMSDDDLRSRVRTASVFARVLPEQKLAIVNALKASGEIVAMTGDGVNDAPALKAADIGVAMGSRGTDVAREASTIVLLDDDFASLVEGVRSGRRIIANLQKALSYILAVHVPIIGLTLIPIFMGWPLVLLPVHIAFLHLVIDPACSVVFEAEPAEADLMRNPPRDPRAPLFDRLSILLSLAQGAIVMVVVVGVFAIALHRGQGELDSRTLTFTTFMIANLALIFTNRSWSTTVLVSLRLPNRALWWVTTGALVFLALVIYVPGLRHLFRYTVLHPLDIVICVTAGISSVIWFELLKRLSDPSSTARLRSGTLALARRRARA
jgi:Ca2+-transporting ATPase